MASASTSYYKVVSFVDDNTIGIVSTTWLNTNSAGKLTSCWPAGSKAQNLAKKHSPVDDKWPVYRVKELYSCENWEGALNKLNKAKVESEAEGNGDNDTNGASAASTSSCNMTLRDKVVEVEGDTIPPPKRHCSGCCDEVKQKLDEILKKMNDPKNTQQPLDDDPQQEPVLQHATLPTLLDFDTKLNIKSERKVLFRQMLSMRMKDVGGTVRNILRNLATVKVWEQFSLHGRAKKKEAFTNLLFYRMLLKMTYRKHDADQGVVDGVIENFLRQAPHQPGGIKHTEKKRLSLAADDESISNSRNDFEESSDSD